jgi:Rrf2 family protein
VISNSSKYALKAVVYLGLYSSEVKKILVKDLSGPTAVPQAYLAKLLQQLSKHNIVSSARGPGGGFYLTDENRAVFLMAIIEVIDGDNRLTSCMLSLKNCDADHPCPLHDLVGETRKNFTRNLQTTTVEDLISDIKRGRSFYPL